MKSSLSAEDTENDLLPHLCSTMAILSLVLAGELLALALVLVQNPLLTFSWVQLGYTSMIVQWIILLSAWALCQLSRIFSRVSVVIGGCLAYGTVLLIALLILVGAWYIMDDDPSGMGLLKNMLLAAIFSGIFLRYLYLQQQLRNQQQAELQSRIQALNARIRPHFLFNSMNAIASLIPVNPELAEQVVENLSELFRESLKETSLVPLAQEIDLCRHYANIEKVRLGDRLQLEWSCDHVLSSVKVPSLTLQPLVENAICHGIQGLPEGGLVSISTRVDKEVLRIIVTNPVSENSDNRTDCLPELKNNGVALQNIAYRLQAYYGKKASIEAKQHCHQGVNYYQVTLTIDMEE
ncbi:hypothetical protein AB835_10055 [Candidatus Endobugula sertula]|uniref:Signal transduction histidine kinase internal region domain-containing protein n=1 Tax=Candidatus Endobugula sertula TaxID=62101 RepID=A0A1D2QNR8_9GAMM|nr:hypothetical protein AB835_10055 [Candidatus Endobugula sertula]